MQAVIKPCSLQGELEIIASKSYAHRALICAALADEPTTILVNALSKDIEVTAKAMEEMGATVEFYSGKIQISPIKEFSKTPVLDCVESGSTARFLLAVAAALFESFKMVGSGNLPNRPMTELSSALKANGVVCEDYIPINATGKLKSGSYSLRGDISSQYISGLLMALPVLTGDSQITLTTPLQSKGYIDITLQVMEAFGVTAQPTENGFTIKGGQKYISPKVFKVEGDWSNAAFFLSAGALSKSITLTGINNNSVQGDMATKEILKSFGAEVDQNEDKITVSKKELAGIVIDAMQIPDLVPILSVVAAGATGKTVIKNIERLRIKESDRVFSVCELINNLGGEAISDENTITINGKGGLVGGCVNSFNDHRIAMAAAIASCICKEDVIIEDALAVNKSYPNFYKDLNSLGGNAVLREEK